MSIVVIPGGPESRISPEDFAKLLASLNISSVSPQDRDDYLAVLQSFESVLNKIDATPDFIPPSLSPRQTTNRAFCPPKPEDNPFNAWSFRCSITANSPQTQTLHGRTFAIKDNISVAGLPTTVGTSPYIFSDDGQWDCSAVDATVVARILEAGGTILGTSTCEAFCASPLSYTSFTGHVHNPRLAGYTAGGSSSGSAALVAAHSIRAGSGKPPTAWGTTAQLALGSDQAGSVRIPASYNGIYGLKPTFGLVPYTGAASMSPMIDHLGPMATNLDDIAALLEVMAGYDDLDPRMTPESPLRSNVKPYGEILAAFRKQLKGAKDASVSPRRAWKIGLLKESFEVSGLTETVRDMVMSTTKSCFAAAGAEVVEVSVPMHVDGPVIWNAATRPSMSTWLLQGRCSGHLTFLPPHIHPRPFSQATFEILNANNPAAVNVMLSEVATDRLLNPGLEAKAHRLVFALRAAYDSALDGVDVLVAPCAPDVAKPLPDPGHNGTVMERMSYPVGTTNNTSPFNVSGHPSLSVPCGFSTRPERPDVPLPVGMQIIGRRFEDDKVLMAAALFERGRDLVDT